MKMHDTGSSVIVTHTKGYLNQIQALINYWLNPLNPSVALIQKPVI